MKGRGTILRIDLSNQRITREPVSAELCRRYIGGEGINTHLFWEHFLKVDPKIDPASPENVLIWGLGPLGGTSYGGGSKSRWTFKGPAYGLFADTTSGGAFGPQLRWAGYDHLVITGRSRYPVYLWIDNDDVELRNAQHLWGKTVREADEAIRQELGEEGTETACIGPAGENQVTYASLTVSRYRSAGRTGAGCVFGSKNLKAIAARGTKGISVHDPRGFLKAMDAELAAINQNPDWRKYFKKYGSMRNMASFNELGWNSYRNGQGGKSPEIDKLSGDWYLEHMQQRSLSCSPGCAAACQAWHHIRGTETPLAKKYENECGQRPDYGAVAPFGVSCDIRDLPAATHMVHLCNEYGLDCFEAGMSISFLMELWQRGIVTEKDVEDWTGKPMSLKWGDHEVVENLLGMISLQNNQMGAILKRGLHQAGQVLEELKGVKVLQYANYGKGGSPHIESMRSRPQLSFGAAVAAIGCHHLKGAGIDENSSSRYLGKPDGGNPWSYELKGAGQALSEIFCSVYNSLGVCKFGGGAHRNISHFPLELYVPGLYALTGMEISAGELYTAGERIVNLQKAFNSRLGLRREQDTVCHRWMNEPMTEGPGKGMKVSDFLEKAKDEYYEYHGWNKVTSLQRKEKLQELGLEEVIEVFEREGIPV